jgi:hypothetical protein
MLNLLSFEPDGGRERYGEYGEALAPLLEKASGRVVFAGDPIGHLRTEALIKGELHPMDPAEPLP